MDLVLYYKGELVQSSELPFSICNEGNLFGDGTRVDIRVYNKKPFLLKDAIKNFTYSNTELELNVNLTEKAVEKIINVLLDVNSLKDAIISLIVLRNESVESLSKNMNNYSDILIIARPVVNENDMTICQGCKLTLSKLRASNRACFDRKIYYLHNPLKVIGSLESRKSQAIDSLLLSIEGDVRECFRSSIFIIKDNIVYTPDLESGIKNRSTRRIVMKIVKHLKIKVFEGVISLNRLLDADECFITSLNFQVLPIVTVDNHSIADGRPGKITNQIIHTFKTITTSDSFEPLF